MNMQQFLEILQNIITLLVGGLALYFKFSTKAQTKAKQVQKVITDITANAIIYIRKAEENFGDTTNAGGKKFGQVVTKLYDLVPEELNKIITKEMIEEIVQSTFNEIEKYAKLQFDEVVDKIPVKKAE